MAVEIKLGGSSKIEPVEIVADGQWVRILGITDRWHNRDANYFKVAASNGLAYILRHDLETQEWTVEKSWRLDA